MKKILIALAALTTISAAALANDNNGNGDRAYDAFDQAPFVQTVKKNKLYTTNYKHVYSNSTQLNSVDTERLSEKNGSADIPTN